MLTLAAIVIALSGTADVPSGIESPWAPVQFLVGEWRGESDGQPGKGSVRSTSTR